MDSLMLLCMLLLLGFAAGTVIFLFFLILFSAEI